MSPDSAAPTPARPSFTCPVCLATSYHPMDVKFAYCGRCHDYTGVQVLPWVVGAHGAAMLVGPGLPPPDEEGEPPSDESASD